MRKFALLAVTAIILVACGKKDPLIGKWNATGGNLPKGVTTTFEFEDGNKLKTAMTGAVMGVEIKIDGNGTYKVEGDKITMTMSEVKLDDSKIPAAFKSAAKNQIENGDMKKPRTGKLKIDGDTATVTDKAEPLTLTRIKS